MTKTVRVRILVAVDGTGDWQARGYAAPDEGRLKTRLSMGMGRVLRYHWVEADIPLPAPEQTIEGTVSDGGTE
jgi:hypothetical protein